MKAVTFDKYGPPDVLTVEELNIPHPSAGEMLVRVAAAAVNPVDLAVRRGDVPSPVLPAVVGWDVSGTVVSTGSIDSRYRVGDHVIAAQSQLADGNGVTAEYVILKEAWTAYAPNNVPLANAAALPLAGLTAQQALAQLGSDFSGRLLVSGAAGSVGGYMIQLATLREWRPAAFVRESDVHALRRLGVSEVFTKRNLPSMQGFDAVIDAAGVPDLLGAVRDGGYFLSLTPFVVPETERSIKVEIYGVQTDGAMLDTLARYVEQGYLTLRIAQNLPFEAANRAHALMETGGIRGKILLSPGG